MLFLKWPHTKQIVDDDDETLTFNTSRFEDKTEVKAALLEGRGRWTLRRYRSRNLKKLWLRLERWKGEGDSALIFVCVDPTTLCVFPSKHMLKAGDQTVKLLAPISRQLVTASNGIPIESSAESSQAFKLTTSVILSNNGPDSIWKSYRDLRGHFRMFMLNGVGKFQLKRFIQLLTISLHTAILLYTVGTLEFILAINTTVGFVTLSIRMALGLIYHTLVGIYVALNPYYLTVVVILWTIRFIGDLFHKPINPCRHYGIGNTSAWRDTLEEWVNTHRQRFLDGQQRTIELYASKASRVIGVERASMV
ncbi:hypothetical protein H4582DRAFT_2051334 [Lactarius indigo]|nr:hypothetical protein H4582DRAFT_2051334 [Lactarius indigo]